MENDIKPPVTDDKLVVDEKAPVTTGDNTDKESNPVNEITKKYDELNERYIRLAAEFENYKKRTKRDSENLIKYSNEKFACDMLEILDNFERALNNKADNSELRTGLEQIHKLYLSILAKNGIVPMNANGSKFDPNQHEAVAHIQSELPEGTIIDEPIKGYKMHDKVIRFAKVAVSSGNSITTDENNKNIKEE